MPTAINNNTRISVTPLSIEHLRLAKDKELICDYARGTLYIKSGNYLMNITDKLKEILISDGMNLDYCPITIEGIGTINLGVALTHIMNNLIGISDIGSETGQLMAGYDLDYLTITNKKKKIQITGFDEAPNGSIPMKINDTLVWRSVTGTIIENGEETTGGNADMVSTPTIKDDRIIEFGENSVQHTNNLNENNINLDISMPSCSTKYYMFKWRLDTGEYDVTLNFPNTSDKNVTLEYEDDNICLANSVYIYTFETFNYGVTWFAKRTKYDKPEFNETIFNAISPRVYTKDQIDAFLSWITPEGEEATNPEG